MRSFKSSGNIQKNEGGPDCTVSNNKPDISYIPDIFIKVSENLDSSRHSVEEFLCLLRKFQVTQNLI